VFNGTSWDRQRAIAGVASGANTDLGIAAAGVGPGYARITAQTAVSAAPNTSAVISTLGAAVAIVSVRGTYTGLSLTVEGTDDGTNWTAVPQWLVYEHVTGAWTGTTSGSSGNKHYTVGCSGYRSVRVNVTALSTGTVNINLAAQQGSVNTGLFPVALIDNAGTKVVFQAPSDGGSGTAGMDVNAQMKVYNAATSLFDRKRVASADAMAVAGLAAASNMVYNGSTWDRQRAIDAYKTAAASPDVGLLATQLADRRFTSVSLGTVIGNTQAWDPNGAAVAVIYVGTSTTGTFTFDVSADGTNWISAETWDVAADAEVSGTNLTPTANKVYRIKAAGYRSIRARTVATLGGTVALLANLSSWQLVSTVNGNTPHDGVDAGNPVKIGGYASQGAPTAVSGDADRVSAWLDRFGRQMVVSKSPTATLSNVASSATNVTVLASNTARLGATIYNDSTAVVYLKFGATASTTSFTVKVAAGGYYELPFGYSGIVDGIWASANGSARVTELT
jgi:hypothetical protein